MPGDFSPHQKFNLEDYDMKPETKRKLDQLIRKYDSIVSKVLTTVKINKLLLSNSNADSLRKNLATLTKNTHQEL